ncbi:uncharacterized protein ARMOST_09561 [Armillaria ostoyae]|uniref:F-box domain-containing protein n=1 Tax=Armillaria ostoyae TaxID=47428 RepID=A0A284RBW3_ARMOS|nr:uncharacterized protein ARMOST_09561 [Armillaria ostoyae]
MMARTAILVLPTPEALHVLQCLPLSIYVIVQPGNWDSHIPSYLHNLPEVGATTSQKITSRLERTLPLYQLQRALISLPSSSQRQIYHSLHTQLHQHADLRPAPLTTATMYTQSSLPTIHNSVIHRHLTDLPQPVQHHEIGYHSLPPELLHHTCIYLDSKTLLTLRLVHRASRIVASHHSHTTLCLSLPPNWQEYPHISLSDIQLLVSDLEILVTLFIQEWHVSLRATAIILDNWPLNRAAFFYHLLPKLTTVTLRGTRCHSHNDPVIQHPFLVPPSVHQLILHNCIFRSHTLETMVLPASQIQYLDLRNVRHSHVPIISHHPTAEECHRFRERMAITTHLGTEITQPIPANLQRLVLHSPLHDSLPSRTEPETSATTEQFRTVSGFLSLLQQVFQRPEMVTAVQKFIAPLQHFPRRFNPALVTELDL